MSYIKNMSWAVSVSASLYQPMPSALSDTQAERSGSVQGHLSRSALHGTVPGSSLAASETPSVSTRAARLSALWLRIQAFGNLDEGWAGCGSGPPSKQTVQLSSKVLTRLPADLRLPHVSASGDGEVVFSWSSSGNRCEAALDSEGYLTWATARGDEVRPGSSISLLDPDNRDVGLDRMFAEVLALDDDC